MNQAQLNYLYLGLFAAGFVLCAVGYDFYGYLSALIAVYAGSAGVFASESSFKWPGATER